MATSPRTLLTSEVWEDKTPCIRDKRLRNPDGSYVETRYTRRVAVLCDLSVKEEECFVVEVADEKLHKHSHVTMSDALNAFGFYSVKSQKFNNATSKVLFPLNSDIVGTPIPRESIINLEEKILEELFIPQGYSDKQCNCLLRTYRLRQHLISVFAASDPHSCYLISGSPDAIDMVLSMFLMFCQAERHNDTSSEGIVKSFLNFKEECRQEKNLSTRE